MQKAMTEKSGQGVRSGEMAGTAIDLLQSHPVAAHFDQMHDPIDGKLAVAASWDNVAGKGVERRIGVVEFFRIGNQDDRQIIKPGIIT